MTAVLFILVGAGVALAAIGPSTFVSTGEDGSASARSAQQPLGSLSANSPAPKEPGTAPNEPGTAPNEPGTSSGPEEQANTKGETEESDGPGAGDAPTNTNSPGVTTASPSSRLPFTGYLAIPILIAGVGLLGAGVAIRRRAARPTAV